MRRQASVSDLRQSAAVMGTQFLRASAIRSELAENLEFAVQARLVAVVDVLRMVQRQVGHVARQRGLDEDQREDVGHLADVLTGLRDEIERILQGAERTDADDGLSMAPPWDQDEMPLLHALLRSKWLPHLLSMPMETTSLPAELFARAATLRRSMMVRDPVDLRTWRVLPPPGALADVSRSTRFEWREARGGVGDDEDDEDEVGVAGDAVAGATSVRKSVDEAGVKASVREAVSRTERRIVLENVPPAHRRTFERVMDVLRDVEEDEEDERA